MYYKKQRGALLLDIAIIMGIFFGIFIGIMNAQSKEDIANRTPEEIIISANSHYEYLLSYKDKNTYVTPVYLKNFEYSLTKLDEEIVALKSKINYTQDKKESWKEEVETLDNKSNELHKIYNQQEKEEENRNK